MGMGIHQSYKVLTSGKVSFHQGLGGNFGVGDPRSFFRLYITLPGVEGQNFSRKQPVDALLWK
jgi:hypothetical protein